MTLADPHRSRSNRAGMPARGAALILVMWILVLLTVLIGTFAVSARIEAAQARQVRSASIAREAARAGVEYAVLRMLAPDIAQRWVPDGRSYADAIGSAKIEIRVLDESGKVDLNSASPQLLAKLLLATGVDPPRASALAAAIVDYRDEDDLVLPGGAENAAYREAGLPYGAKNKPYESVAEVQRVLGMDHALYQQLAPLLTVYSGGEPNPLFAPRTVLLALGYAPDAVDLFIAQRGSWQPGSGPPPPLPSGQAFVPQPGTGTYDIRSRAMLVDGTSLTLDAIVRVSQAGPFGQLYVPMQWREGDAY
jgi:general secretion pathway protein K